MEAIVAAAERDAAPEIIEAVVQTGAAETRYRRAGRGAPVLLLSRDGADDSAGSVIFRALAGHCRVIAPIVGTAPGVDVDGADAHPSDALPEWLRGVIDGLGLIRPCIVAEGDLAVPALSFARADPERVDRLVVLGRGPDDPASGDADGDAIDPDDPPILILRNRPNGSTAIPEDLVPRMIGFLLAETAGADGRMRRVDLADGARRY